MKTVVVLSGAGISAESGLKTFRDADGLWEGYRVEDVATPEAWERNPSLVLDFYNARRRQVAAASPNAAHLALARLQEAFDTFIVTQNVDDLHERAGSRQVVHLHGEIRKSRSTKDGSLVQEIEGTELSMGDECSLGSQLRPHIVWFGEEVPLLSTALDLVKTADVGLIVGTSLQVYPAAGLIHEFRPNCPVYYVDPNPAPVTRRGQLTVLAERATRGVPMVVEELLELPVRQRTAT